MLLVVLSAIAALLGVTAAATAATPKYTVSIAVSPVTVLVHHSVAVTGAVSPAAAGKVVDLQRYYSGKWYTITTAKLTSTSRYSFSVLRSKVGAWKLRVYKPKGGTRAAGASKTITVYAAATAYKVNLAQAPATVLPFELVTFTGSTSPKTPARILELQRYVSGTWTKVTTFKLSKSSSYSVVTHPELAGQTVPYRIHEPYSATIAEGNSASRSVTVQDNGSKVVARPATVTPTASQALSVTGDPLATQTTVLAAGSPVPAVGGFLVLPASDAAPDGLLGKVTAVVANPDSTHTVTTTRAKFDDAFSTYIVASSHQLTPADVTTVPAATQGLQSASTGPGSPFEVQVSKAGWTCTNRDSGQTISVTADLGELKFGFDLNALTPQLAISFDAKPVLKTRLSFTGTASCTLANSRLLAIRFPVPAGAIPTVVTLEPVFKVSVSGSAEVGLDYSPRIHFFAQAGALGSSHEVSTSVSSTVLEASGKATAFLGLRVNILAAGVLGVEGNIGPEVSLTVKPCGVSVDYALRAELSAKLDLWFKKWTYTLAAGLFSGPPLASCRTPTPSPSPSPSPPPSPNPSPSPSPSPSPGTGAIAIAAGDLHTCALSNGGGVKCWGGNVYGQLGDGTNTDSSGPVEVTGLTSGLTAISAGSMHTCALTSAGTAKCWGFNSWGQLGNGSTGLERSNVPLEVTGLDSPVTAISGGGYHTCALTIGGAVKCWGGNVHGELGDGTTTTSAVPVGVTGLDSGVIAISAAYEHTCAITSSGTVKCWGNNATGELGNGTTTDSAVPVNVTGLSSGVTAISAGGVAGDPGPGHTCVLINGAVKCWGANIGGILGNGTYADSAVPVDVTGLGSGVAAISAGGYHTCAMTGSGGAKCWGNGGNLQLGNGTNAGSTIPIDVSGMGSGVTAISAGYTHTCALISSGAIKCWGQNTYGALGNGTTVDSSVPVGVVGFE